MRRQLFYFYFPFCLLGLIFSACSHTVSGSRIYQHIFFPLTNDTAYSVSSQLKVRIPGGWSAAEDRDCKCIDLWLIRNDFSATLNLFAISPEGFISQHPEADTIASAMNYSKEMKKTKLKESFKPDLGKEEYFTLDGKIFAAYEYEGDEGLPVRVVVFRHAGRFYEFAAIPSAKVGKRSVNTDTLFSVQQAVLTSIR